MLPGLELMGCPLAVPAEVMRHVIHVESSYNPYAIGIVGGHLARQPKTLPEALATVRMLESRGYNFSLGLAQVNRYNLEKYGLGTYAEAFQPCANLLAGSRILAECNRRAGGHWGRSFSCYYSGNFVTGYRQGYVQKVERSLWGERVAQSAGVAPIPVVGKGAKSHAGNRRPAGGARRVVRGRNNSPAPVRNEGQLDPRSLADRRGGAAPVAGTQTPPPASVAMPVKVLPALAAPMTPALAGDNAFVF